MTGHKPQRWIAGLFSIMVIQLTQVTGKSTSRSDDATVAVGAKPS
jgi:hypothetical protein